MSRQNRDQSRSACWRSVAIPSVGGQTRSLPSRKISRHIKNTYGAPADSELRSLCFGWSGATPMLSLPDGEGSQPRKESFMSQARSTQTAKSPGPGSMTAQRSSEFSVLVTSIHKVEADGVRVFYRAAGDPNSPVVLLLHGFPTSSFMFR